jgi:hypothetical protein
MSGVAGEVRRRVGIVRRNKVTEITADERLDGVKVLCQMPRNALYVRDG